MPADISLEKTLPSNLEAERAVLGACLLEERAIWAATEHIVPEDFYLDAHRLIFRRMTELAAEGKAIDIITLRAELKRHDEEETAGGPVYLVDLTRGLPKGLNIPHYARLVKETATARMLIRLCSDTLHRCYEAEERPADLLEGHEGQLFKIAARAITGGFEAADQTVDRVYREIEEVSNQKSAVTGIHTGITELDRMTAGLHPGELVIIAGRPGLGKSSLCSTLALHAASRGKSVGILSLEMGREELTRRHLSNLAEVDFHKLKTGFLNKEDWGRLSRATSEMSTWPLHIDDAGDCTTLQLRARAQRLALEKGLDLLIVDYLQLLQGGARRYDNRTHEVTDISRTLKALAKELKIPVLAAAQLNRRVEEQNRRPRLSDLRESGSIEQDADLVLMLWREGGEENEGVAELHVAKQRNGATGSFRLVFIKQFMKFANLWSEE